VRTAGNPTGRSHVTPHEVGPKGSNVDTTILRAMALLVLPLLLLAACGEEERPAAPGIDEGPAAEAPPEDPSEAVVEAEADEGTVAAELTVGPERISPGEQTTANVVNHGEVPIGYGRPIGVERWDGEAWVHWPPADEAAWTMELLLLGPGETGVDEAFPFTDERPEPGWYRLTKDVHAESTGDPPQLTIRARVLVEG
jgi:hypothetical protein